MLAKTFYMRLAGSNVVRGRRMYGPYTVAVALMSGMCFIILNLVLSQSIANLSYGPTMQAIFTIGIVVMILFTVGYILYINSFLIKQRKTELGLYGVLGMERRHVARVVIWEGLMLGLGALTLGLMGGAVFGRLAFLLLMNIIDSAKGSTFSLDWGAMLMTVGIFTAIFILTTLYNLNQVRMSSPIDLLKGERKGEKKTRFAIPMALLGFVLLGIAYAIAIRSNDSMLALLQFWPAVILVIIATWLLFTGGSVLILTLLKRNRRFYYRPRNFITVSGLMHRMKQNAAGLANICILSTMVMVTVSCCCALYFGCEAIMQRQSPDDFRLETHFENARAQQDVLSDAYGMAADMAAAHGVIISEPVTYRFFRQAISVRDGAFAFYQDDGTLAYSPGDPDIAYLAGEIVPLSDYNAATGSQETLGEGEVLLLTRHKSLRILEVPTEAAPLLVKKILYDSPLTQGKNGPYEDTVFFIVPDDFTGQMAQILAPGLSDYSLRTRMTFNIDAASEDGYALSVDLRAAFRQLCEDASAQCADTGSTYAMHSIYENRVEGYTLYGGLLFLGVFFAVLFLTNTVLILYFKQISEGYEDNERFIILRNIGLSDQEVRSTINRQMLIVFLIPLVVALSHVLAANNMIRMLLASFMLTDFTLTLLCILITSLVFIVVYLIVYRLTARTYYRIVTSRAA